MTSTLAQNHYYKYRVYECKWQVLEEISITLQTGRIKTDHSKIQLAKQTKNPEISK